MSADYSPPGLLVALALPWLCGSLWMQWLLTRTGRCNVFVVLGQGFFLGYFITTLLIRVCSLLGVPLSFAGIATVVAGVAVLGLLCLRLHSTPPQPAVAPVALRTPPGWQLAAGLCLLTLIAWRQFTLLEELLLRPLYAWDAWMNWAPKAIVWFHSGTLVEFVPPDLWLSAGDAQLYTLGNRQASTYPITVPLIQLWGMLGAGTWDHGAVYLPWLLAPLALGLALFGHLRLAGVAALPALLACYLLLSLPLLNAHTALAGYADLWVAAAFSLGVCALYEWRQSRHWAHAVLVLWLALLCSQLKQPGIVLGLVLLACCARAWLLPRPVLVVIAVGGAGMLAALALVLGPGFDIPGIGRIALDAGTLELGRFGRFTFALRNVAPAFIESLFVMLNWNLLWYLLAACVLWRAAHRQCKGLAHDEVLATVAGLLFVGGVFFLERYAQQALNFVTLNRALLYPVPALIFCMFLTFRQRASAR